MIGRHFVRLAATVLMAVAGISLYYVDDVRTARAQTRQLIDDAFAKYGRTVQASDLPADRLTALIAVEDPMFWQHGGVDLTTPGAGMTTITQGLVKVLFFPSGFKPGIAKISQTLIADYALDPLSSKTEQLNLFLNIVYLGSENGAPVHGFDAAAKTYFGKPLGDLSRAQFLALIGMTIAPDALKPGTDASALRVRQIEKYLSGDIKPASLLDIAYDGKRGGSFSEELLMSLLRAMTHAQPHVGG